jgi:hypothetical protein
VPKKRDLSGKPDKRPRSTKAQMGELYQEIEAALKKEYPISLRRLYYILIGRGKPHLVSKDERDYDRVGNALKYLRKCGRVPWNRIIDNTRRLHVPTTFISIGHGLKVLLDVFRFDPWRDQDCLVFCLTEKDALYNLLVPVTNEYVVPLGVIRGGCSWTFLHDLAMQCKDAGKPVFIYYLGDHDEAGINVEAAAEEFIREYAPEAEIHWQRLAVTFEQIAEYNLITREPKKNKYPSQRWLDLSEEQQKVAIEVDAMATPTVLGILREAIEKRIDFAVWNQTLDRERRAQAQLRKWISRRGGK